MELIGFYVVCLILSLIGEFSSSGTMCMTVYYHYTDENGLKGILQSRRIFQSSCGKHDEGVYLTRLSPEHGRKKISQNNWDGGWEYNEMWGKTDYAISVSLPDHRVEEYDGIFVFREDVNLDLTTYRLYSKNGDHVDLESECSYGEREIVYRTGKKRSKCTIL